LTGDIPERGSVARDLRQPAGVLLAIHKVELRIMTGGARALTISREALFSEEHLTETHRFTLLAIPIGGIGRKVPRPLKPQCPLPIGFGEEGIIG